MKRTLVGMLAVCGAFVAMNPMTANAQVAGATVVAFTGATTSLTTVDWVNNTGSYAFSGSCVLGAGVAVTVPPPSVTTGCGVQASGTYINVVCGTGLTGLGLTDTATATSGTNSATTKYSIVFVATVGVLVGEVTSINGQAAVGAEAGVVQINAIPTAPNPGDTAHLGACTTQFSVEVVAAGAGAAA
jgi:hypothetical protein